MKKYIIFIASFAVLYMLFQVSSGFVLTLFHNPNVNTVTVTGQTVSFGKSEMNSFFILGVFLTGTLAYFISEKLSKA